MASRAPRRVTAGKPATAPRRVRPTQAQRSAATRELLLATAIKCLFEHGYGTTTTIMVAEEAGVSRGAMLHQFPNKADLMTFVVESVFEQEVDLYRELLKGIDDPKERLLSYPAAVWKLTSRPAGVAVLEILLGSRSDTVLAEMLEPVLAKIDSTALTELQSELKRSISIPLFQLIVGVARGLAVSQVIAPRGGDGGPAVHLFEQLLRDGLEAGTLHPEDKKVKRTRKSKDKAAK